MFKVFKHQQGTQNIYCRLGACSRVSSFILTGFTETFYFKETENAATILKLYVES